MSAPLTDQVTSCFVIDVLRKSRNDPLVVFLKGLFEDESVVKIVHDCRMDSDALWHHLGIKLANVHDTSCWHTAIFGTEDVNLNETLRAYGLAQNMIRDKNIYQTNPAFWTTRPLTPQMIEWASADIKSLFLMREAQKNRASLSASQSAEKMSDAYCDDVRGKQVSTVRVANPGFFIGTGGSNLRALQRSSGTKIYGIGKRTDKTFMVFYDTEADLAKVKRAASA
mmetsp:Transcript_270/g.608  ORF Transcript_270/g.608 Transcript_270/m.608 type:complete len:225 (+) Transcript_270:303-977(+)|eukprot:CAMPEP_0173409670 /NCGR_PEP_ID=MMETSP1356-20130122/72679_1 /TAXON_ID=77927 ORGANISM="Hemiselmis virescens, Strain PCC157" /NCGR_SAMPLE_ID=MMETSP1356 /ASSEMBLY_ACC=CAM_ASM_000847 /LENGTH=224 /DNA_ID=CAMNT_0014371185 /DNA_START=221 /DNA_END=895 /DNA_ORIENTATION=+